MARIDWVEERLQVWARWKIARGSGHMGFASVDLGGSNGGRSGYVTAAIPLLDVEAAETDEAVQQLHPGGLRLTVHEYYCGPGGIDDKLKRLCCAKATLMRRIEQAHEQMAVHFRQVRERREAERRRVEALQRGSFPR